MVQPQKAQKRSFGERCCGSNCDHTVSFYLSLCCFSSTRRKHTTETCLQNCSPQCAWCRMYGSDLNMEITCWKINPAA